LYSALMLSTGPKFLLLSQLQAKVRPPKSMKMGKCLANGVCCTQVGSGGEQQEHQQSVSVERCAACPWAVCCCHPGVKDTSAVSLGPQAQHQRASNRLADPADLTAVDTKPHRQETLALLQAVALQGHAVWDGLGTAHCGPSSSSLWLSGVRQIKEKTAEGATNRARRDSSTEQKSAASAKGRGSACA
jgi:hypothetical protein